MLSVLLSPSHRLYEVDRVLAVFFLSIFFPSSSQAATAASKKALVNLEEARLVRITFTSYFSLLHVSLLTLYYCSFLHVLLLTSSRLIAHSLLLLVSSRLTAHSFTSHCSLFIIARSFTSYCSLLHVSLLTLYYCSFLPVLLLIPLRLTAHSSIF